MAVVDRVMRAYASKHDLNPSQAAFVRNELSKIINELMAGSRPVDPKGGNEAPGNLGQQTVEPSRLWSAIPKGR
jgi:hypothetical protein